MRDDNGVWIVWARGNYGEKELKSVHASELDALRELNGKQDYDAEGADFVPFGEGLKP